MKNLDEKIARWSAPPSSTEADRISNAERAIRKAISASSDLANLDLTIFVHGSYRNNVNVRANSDIDIGILCKNTFHYRYTGLASKPANIVPATYTYDEFKQDSIRAIDSYFGYYNYSVGNKAIDIKSNSYRVDADVGLFFEYREYTDDQDYIPGVCIPVSGGNLIINWPEQHYNNAVEKNKRTSRRYKSLVRTAKNLQYEMRENLFFYDMLPGFFIECALYNVPDYLYHSPPSTQVLYDVVNFICLEPIERIRTWTEVSERKMLFGSHQKWDFEDAIGSIKKMRGYIIS